MSVPALNIPIRADTSKFRQDMESTSSIAGTAVRGITAQVIKMNAGFLATQGAAGGAALAFGGVLGVLGPIAAGVAVVSNAFKLMGYATELAKKQIEEFNEVADKAAGAGVSTDFFQRFTKTGPAAVLSIDEVTAALKRFNEASTERLGGSDIQQRIAELTKAGNFGGNTGGAAFGLANDAEGKLRAIVSLIDQAMQKGERLAAIDIAGKAFGAPVAAALQKNSSYLDDMLTRADAMNKSQIISPEDVGRAIELKERMDAAQKTLSEKWKPIQDDLAKLGMNYHESWVGITESMASAVGYATQLYSVLKNLPTSIGNASMWKSITDATTTAEGRAASEQSLGITSDPVAMGQLNANNKLRAALQNHGNVTRGMQQATEVQSAVRGDTSKNPSDPGGDQGADQFDRASEAIQKHTARLEADTSAVGLGAGALEEFRAAAALTTAAQQAGLPITQAMADKIQDLAQDAGNAAEALAKARVASEIKTSRGTAFLTSEDAAIARSLVSIYGDDIPRALASSEAAQMRFNNGLKSMSDLGQEINRGMFVEFGQSIRNGATAFDALKTAGTSALGKIADKLMSIASDNLWKSAFGGSGGSGGGGLLGGLIGSLFGGSNPIAPGGTVPGAEGLTSVGGAPLGFASGGYTGAGGKYQPAGIVHKGEYVMDAATTSRIGVGNLNRLRGYADGGYVDAPLIPPSTPAKAQGGESRQANGPQGVHVTVGVTVDNDGNLKAYVKDIADKTATKTVTKFAGSPAFNAYVHKGVMDGKTRRIL